ncbi:NUDIX hydrolase [Macrococcus carouselicus]|uniref:NUDIX domain-containing protein n=1 Tax=Macrococcus carouselicus TaxID=69969 RepID=A0A9Q8CLR8_9STAP|nr:NUDIX domain-containing protein [Macrococcus carouselicus]TDM02435.1 NUDIX domain-containing protein [Macrococcus carouselicus]
MADINCAALVYIEDSKLLLVKVRELEKYYLPGGKIEAGEEPIDTAIREVHEELNVELDKKQVHYLGRVEGPAYPQDATVSLECFTYEGSLEEAVRHNEITGIRYFDLEHSDLIAPAVLVLIDKLNSKALVYDK